MLKLFDYIYIILSYCLLFVCLLVLFVVVFCWLDHIMHMGRIYLYIHSFWPYYIYNSSMLAHQMPPRRDNRRNVAGGDNNGNDVPPYMQQLLQGQAQLIQLLAQNMGNNNNNNNNPPPPPPVDMLTRFLRLNPQRFSSSPEPIVADDWLRAVNKNLDTVGCTDAERVRFASHLLEGPAAAWWDKIGRAHV